MGKPTGFKEFARETASRRPVSERVKDWKEYELHLPAERLKQQAARCMDCGVPFCQNGCPLGNIIPDWNDLVYREQWREAIERLHATNNFPDFTGTLCPAPCENSCVLGMNTYNQPVTIKKIESEIIEHAWEAGWVKPLIPQTLTGKKVAVVGSGPAGLAAAQQLTRAGHTVTVFERADRIGGLLRYGIPEFKFEKAKLDRRLKQMEAEGTKFVVNANVGENPSVAELKKNFDAVVLCAGSTQARDLNVPGRELKGVYFAMEYLTQANKVQEGDKVADQITAKDKHVVVLGGGDTGADCIGTALRQGAKSVTSLELMPKPPLERAADNPWPQWARIFRTAGAHEEGGERLFSLLTKKLSGENGLVKKLHAVKLEWAGPNMKEVSGSDFEIPADLVLLAMGFVGPEKNRLINDLGLELDPRGNVKADTNKMTNVPGVFVAGDMTRGQSLIVWAISEGRKAAQGVDRYLMGQTSLTSVL